MTAFDDGSLLVLGGARSGKSRFAQQLAEACEGPLLYVATGQALDAEMVSRIEAHQKVRGARWQTIEAPLDLADIVRTEGKGVMLIDCLTLWASNLIFAERDVAAATADLCAAITAAPGRIILVSNEVGLGIVPDNALARRFRDVAGTINQAVAQAADRVVFVAAGLPLWLKR